jgi:hypothetical protein
MKVRALQPFDLGQGGGLRYPSVVGQTYDLPERRARQLVRIGAAELAEDNPVKAAAKKVAKKVASKKVQKAD